MEANVDLIPHAHATLKYARISSRKVKIVADLIKGKNVDEALAIFKIHTKSFIRDIREIIKISYSKCLKIIII